MNGPTHLSSLELAAWVDGLTHQRLAVVEDDNNDAYLASIDYHLVPLRAELQRRVDRHAHGAAPNSFAPWWETARDTAREVRQSVDILYPLDVIGWRPSRRSTKQVAGPCPLCQDGVDRFIVWPDGDDGVGRFWCRHCNLSGDVIDLYRWTQGDSFVRAVEHLAAVAGIPLTQPGANELSIVADNALRARHPEVA